ncbi:MAG: hypothetical protein Q8880_01200 [Bacteroidota bacterium]|nr:hypothetical protein [Bacteroidota bacterium]
MIFKMKLRKSFAVIVVIMLILINIVKATPSTQIWIPSTDIQKFKTLHLGIDNYLRLYNVDNSRGAAIYDFGLTGGILNIKNKLQAEAGFDYMYMGDFYYDKSPVYFNAKLATPEDSICRGFPSIAIGAYNFGTKNNLTNYNIAYGLVAKTMGKLGRISAGYYFGNEKVLLDENGTKSNSGLLLSWDRQMTEISDKLWMAVDYQGGKNYLGALNIGFSWAFSDKVSVLIAYDIYNNHNAYYNTKDKNANSFTTQLDINF